MRALKSWIIRYRRLLTLLLALLIGTAAVLLTPRGGPPACSPDCLYGAFLRFFWQGRWILGTLLAATLALEIIDCLCTVGQRRSSPDE